MNAKYGIVFYIISTEGTLRLPKTFDNDPIPSHPRKMKIQKDKTHDSEGLHSNFNEPR